MLIVDPFDKSPKYYVKVFCRHHKKMDHVHSKNGPGHRAVCVVVPFEMQSVEFVITANEKKDVKRKRHYKTDFYSENVFPTRTQVQVNGRYKAYQKYDKNDGRKRKVRQRVL